MPASRAGSAAPPPMWRAVFLGYGAWVGWLGAMLVANARVITFTVRPAGAGIGSWCFKHGYAKQQDYFWYAVAVAAAVAGAGSALLARRGLRARGWRGTSGTWALPLAVVCLAGATGLSIVGLATPLPILPALALAGAGAVLPWLDRRWLAAEIPPLEAGEPAPASPPDLRWWAASAAVVAAAWVWDPCIRYRVLDGLHEGFVLLYVQGWLAGDVPNLTTRTAYGPLYLRSLIWWMQAFGLTMSVARYYFAAAQIAGTIVHLVLIRLICRSWPAALVGTWLMLTCSTAPDIQYGWANALRTAVPLAALWACWRGAVRGNIRMLIAAGAVGGGWLLYSQEHAVACAAASVTMLAALGVRDGAAVSFRRLVAWGGGAVTAVAVLLFVAFGSRTAEAFRLLATGNTLASRLLGFGAFPLPTLPPAWSILGVGDIVTVVTVWWPGLVGGLALAWLVTAPRAATIGRGALALGLAVAALLDQVPMLTLPRAQIESSAPAAILLATLALDHAWGRRLRAPFAAAGLLLVAVGFGRMAPYWVNMVAKMECVTVPHLYAPSTIPRLGALEIPPEQRESLVNFIGGVRALCPPGKRIFFAAVSYEYVPFLADRAALAPFPRDLDAGSAAEQDEVLAALDREKPPVAIMRDDGLFLSYAEEHPRELAYIKSHYRLEAVAGDVSVYVRKR